MSKHDLRIVYLGTPEFAVEALKCLVENDYNVVAVVTAPDKPVGRHQNRLQPTPVKEYALSAGLPVMQPERLKDETFLEQLRSYQADLFVVVAFRMLPEVVWAMPRLGTFNIHASLLPQYRGAAPINWAIINGETETGLTTFFLQHDIDTGDIISQIRVPIADDTTCGQLHDQLMALSGQLAMQTIDDIINGTAQITPQARLTTDRPLCPAPKLFKENCRIDLTKSVDEIANFVRGLSPYPGAWSILQSGNTQQEIKIFSAYKIVQPHTLPAGTIVTDGRKTLDVALHGGLLRITELQLAGKKRMPATVFLCGFKPVGNETLL